MILRLFFVSIFMSLSAGCAGTLDREVSMNTAEPCPFSENTNLSEPLCFYKTAEKNYEYAILATLSYSEEKNAAKNIKQFPLPPTIRSANVTLSEDFKSVRGFQFKVFDRVSGNGTTERIISYRGTDEFWADWIATNLFGSLKQNKAALRLFDEVSSGADKISVVGDSLGGALATQVSVCKPVNQRLALNTSPRFKTKLCPAAEGLEKNIGNTFLFQEAGQLLGVTTPFNYSTQLYTKVDCMGERSSVKQHNAHALAACITLDASHVSEAATNYIAENCDLFTEIARNGKFRGVQYERLRSICSN